MPAPPASAPAEPFRPCWGRNKTYKPWIEIPADCLAAAAGFFVVLAQKRIPFPPTGIPWWAGEMVGKYGCRLTAYRGQWAAFLNARRYQMDCIPEHKRGEAPHGARVQAAIGLRPGRLRLRPQSGLVQMRVIYAAFGSENHTPGIHMILQEGVEWFILSPGWGKVRRSRIRGSREAADHRNVNLADESKDTSRIQLAANCQLLTAVVSTVSSFIPPTGIYQRPLTYDSYQDSSPAAQNDYGGGKGKHVTLTINCGASRHHYPRL